MPCRAVPCLLLSSSSRRLARLGRRKYQGYTGHAANIIGCAEPSIGHFSPESFPWDILLGYLYLSVTITNRIPNPNPKLISLAIFIV